MSKENKELYEFGLFRLDVAEHFLARISGGERIQLSEKAFETLCILVRNGGHLVRKDELMNQVWADAFVEENNLDKCIYAIRRALGEKPGEQKYIETVRKHGYRFVAEVRRIEEKIKPIDNESAIHTEPKQLPTQRFPRRVEQTNAQNRGAVIALADWRREADEIETLEQKISLPTSAKQNTASELTFTVPTEKSSEIETKPINFPQITKRRKGLIRGLKYLLCGLGVGFVFLILLQVVNIVAMLLFSENGLLLGTSNQLANRIGNLLTLLMIPIGLGFFFGIGLFLFGNARVVYAVFEKESSKLKPLLFERLIALVIVIIILAVAIPNLIFSYLEANRAKQLIAAKSPLVFQSIQASRLTDNGTASLAEISPDGRFVAFVNHQDGKGSLVVRQVVTDNVVLIVPPAPVNFYQPSFTSDGNFIYYVQVENGVGTLFQIPTLGGEIIKIIVDVDSKVTLSPDGKRIGFIRHNPNEGGDTIIIANNDGTNPESFLQTNEINYDQFFNDIDWSPDNNKILVGVFKNKGEPNQKWQIASVGLNDKKLEVVGEKDWHKVRNFEWMRNGAGIVLVGRANSGEDSQVWHLSYPIGERRQITTDTSNYNSVSVSADGSLMVATRVDVISSLWSRTPQTGEMRQLIAENSNMLGYAGISQMPDGKILFVKSIGKKINIFSIEETGSSEKQLTSVNSINQSPAATPDGKYIVFTSNRTGIFSIWRMNADGINAVQLTDVKTGNDTHLQITKDGRSVVFIRQTIDGGKEKLMKVSIDGGEAVPIMPENTMMEVLPQISPNGKLLSYLTYWFDSNNPKIEPKVRVVSFDGEKIIKIVNEFETNVAVQFSFSPDNKSLTYIKKGGIDNLWSLSLSDRTEKPLTNFTSGYISNFIWSNDGKKLYIVRAIYNSDLVLITDDAKAEVGN